MSQKAARAFIEKLKTDVEFRRMVTAIDNAEDRVAFINAEGFDCTAEEINALERQISERDVDKICGGQTVLGDDFFNWKAIVKNLVFRKLFK